MAQKTVKIGGDKAIKSLAVVIGKETYNIPLVGSMKRKDILALKDDESVFNMFARYIPAEVLEELTVDEYNQLAQAWSDENKDANDASLGES